MKRVRCFLLLAALATSVGAAASSITPSVTGTVSQVSPGSASTLVTINGHAYAMTSDTQPGGTRPTVRAGQVVTAYLAADGKTVILIQPVVTGATHP